MYYLEMSVNEIPLGTAVFATADEAKAKLYGLAEMLANHDKGLMLEAMGEAFAEIETEQTYCYSIEIEPFELMLIFADEDIIEDALMN